MVWFTRKRHPIVKKIFNVLLEKRFDDAWINSVYQDNDQLIANIRIPEHKDLKDLDRILPNLQQELAATAVKLGKVKGKHVEILFGMKDLGKYEIRHDDNSLAPMLTNDSLQVKFPSAFGEYILDFEDGASCHMLNGGATRMGKTCLLLYLTTVLFIQNKGEVQICISSAKLKDYYPFNGIRQVKMTKDEQGMEKMLEDLLSEYKQRDTLLYSPSLAKATDAKSVRKLYPEYYHKFKPIFLVIDEYARFAENEKIQDMVTELVETAGFVNVHVIIASQRPDASTVLKSRLRANLMVRMAFTTVDKKNSEIILDQEGAEKLGEIAGRALLRDGGMNIIQVPLIEAVDCDKLLEPYRSVIDESERCENHEISEAIPSPIEKPTGEVVFSEQQESSNCGQSSHAKTKTRRKNPSRSKTERPVLPVYAEPIYNTPKQHED